MHTGKQRKQTLWDVLSTYLMLFPATNTKVCSLQNRFSPNQPELLPYKGLLYTCVRVRLHVGCCTEVRYGFGEHSTQLLSPCYLVGLLSPPVNSNSWRALKADVEKNSAVTTWSQSVPFLHSVPVCPSFAQTHSHVHIHNLRRYVWAGISLEFEWFAIQRLSFSA